jgi:hypothetical protein
MDAEIAAMRRLAGWALVALCLAGSASAQSGWKEYTYPADGFAARYPGEPVISEQAYATRFGSSVTERVYSYDSGGVIYAVAIADFGTSRPAEDEAIDEAADRLMAMGQLTHDVSARLNWNYGRELRVEAADGTTYTDAIFLIDRKLFQLKVTYPVRNSDPSGSAGIHYFQQAVRLLN